MAQSIRGRIHYYIEFGRLLVFGPTRSESEHAGMMLDRVWEELTTRRDTMKPMIGNNIVILNQATMIVALQLYFETIYKEGMAPHVTSVGLSKDVNSFEVRLTEPLEQVFEREAR